MDVKALARPVVFPRLVGIGVVKKGGRRLDLQPLEGLAIPDGLFPGLILNFSQLLGQFPFLFSFCFVG